MLTIDRINELALALKFENSNIYNFAPARKYLKNTVLIIGKTGAGKSTIINILANRKLFGKKEKGNIIIDAVDSVSKIVHGGTSGTDKPKCYIEQQYTYFDCPGFFDNNSEEQEIKTAFYINNLFRRAKKVKLLVVIQDADTQGRINNLKELFTALMKMFNDDIVQYCYGRIALIITKVSQQDDIEDAIERLKALYPSLGMQAKLLFDDIISNHLIIFPKQKGPIDSTNLKANLISHLSKMDWIIHKTSIFVSSKTKQKLSNCFSSTKQKYLDQLQIFSQQLKAFYDSRLESQREDENIQELKKIKRNFKKIKPIESIIFAHSLPRYTVQLIDNFKSAGIFLPYQCQKALNHKLFNQELIIFYDKLIGQLEQFHTSINVSYYFDSIITQIIDQANQKISEINKLIRDRQQEKNRMRIYRELQNKRREAEREQEQYQNEKRQSERNLEQLRKRLEVMKILQKNRETRDKERKQELKRQKAYIEQQNNRRREQQERANSKSWCSLI